MQSALELEIEEAIRRWRGSNGSVNRWDNSVDFLRYFAEARPDYVRQHIIDYFDLGGTAKVSLSTDEDMGYIVINSISITIDTPGIEDATSWTGIYFQDVPIEITAIPQQGYRFLRWEGALGINSVTETINITLEDDVSLRAVFEVDE
jgi:hypothetical protein